MLKTILKEAEKIRWELSTLKMDGRPSLVTSLTRWQRSAEDAAWSFRLTGDHWVVSRAHCSRATKRALQDAHDAARPAALAIIEKSAAGGT